MSTPVKIDEIEKRIGKVDTELASIRKLAFQDQHLYHEIFMLEKGITKVLNMIHKLKSQ